MRSARFAWTGRHLLLSCAVLLSGVSLPTLAWNAAGHRLVASIAWQECTPATRRHIAALLREHPAEARWNAQLARRQAPGDPELARFAEAATWPDELRRERGDDRAAAHRDWHYINWIVGAPPRTSRGGQLDRAIAAQVAVLVGQDAAPAMQAEALAWVAHLVADAHQPLHVASWPLADGSFDDGGLTVLLRDPARPTPMPLSLHAWWDDLPGPPWLRGDRLARRTKEVMDENGSAPVTTGSPEAWLQESFAAAGDWVRPDIGDNTTWEVDDIYRARARNWSSRRLHEAGVRLGRLLNRVLDATQPTRKR